MGAWIETEKKHGLLVEVFVAPRMGAWIETWASYIININSLSRPAWARGLKHPLHLK